MSDSDILSGLGIEPWEPAEAEAARLTALWAPPSYFSALAGVERSGVIEIAAGAIDAAKTLTREIVYQKKGACFAWTFEVEVEAQHWKTMEEHMRSGLPLSVNGLKAYVRGEHWEGDRVLFQIEVRG